MESFAGLPKYGSKKRKSKSISRWTGGKATGQSYIGIYEVVDRMKKYLESIFALITTFFIMAGILVVFLIFTKKEDDSYPIVMMGDSIFGQYRDVTGVAFYLSEELEVPVFNGAFGGTAMALQNKEDKPSYYMDAFTFAGLTKAMAHQDFGVQQTVRTKDVPTAHFASVIDEMERIDFHKTKVLFICYGLNDYMAGTPLEDPGNPYNEFTFAGALRSGINRLKAEYPDMEIYVVSSTYCWFLNSNTNCENNDYGGGFLEEYVNTEKEVAQELGVTFLDWYHDFYSHENFEFWREHTEDGMHPNERTRKWMARLLTEAIR